MESSLREDWCGHAWNSYKEELTNLLQDAIKEDSSEKETMAIMLEMLKIAKLKERIKQDEEV